MFGVLSIPSQPDRAEKRGELVFRTVLSLKNLPHIDTPHIDAHSAGAMLVRDAVRLGPRCWL